MPSRPVIGVIGSGRALSGYLLRVNPFDQPGVEAYKRNMFALLGRKGYEQQRDALVKRIKEVLGA